MKRLLLVFVSLLLLSGLWFSSVSTVTAAQDDHAAEEQGEPGGGSAEGAGVLIILVGLGVITVIGGAYWSRQSQATEKSSS